jgi:hypothetical protein
MGDDRTVSVEQLGHLIVHHDDSLAVTRPSATQPAIPAMEVTTPQREYNREAWLGKRKGCEQPVICVDEVVRPRKRFTEDCWVERQVIAHTSWRAGCHLSRNRACRDVDPAGLERAPFLVEKRRTRTIREPEYVNQRISDLWWQVVLVSSRFAALARPDRATAIV